MPRSITVTLVIMRTVEFTASPGSEEELIHKNLEALSGLSDLKIFHDEVVNLKKAELNKMETDFDSNLKEIEYEINDQPEKIWNQLLIDILNQIRAKLLIISNHIEGDTFPS